MKNKTNKVVGLVTQNATLPKVKPFGGVFTDCPVKIGQSTPMG